jgi:hypothetical protein
MGTHYVTRELLATVTTRGKAADLFQAARSTASFTMKLTARSVSGLPGRLGRLVRYVGQQPVHPVEWFQRGWRKPGLSTVRILRPS